MRTGLPATLVAILFLARAEATPVLLVHGILDSPRSMQPMARYLTEHGREVYFVALTPNNGSGDLRLLAREVQAKARQLFGRRKFDLVGFSMGGLACRYYVERLGGWKQVRTLVTISAPSHGTWWAWLAGGKGCRQMRPGSDFLNDLNAGPTRLEQVHYTSIWTPLDLMIIPSASSKMPAGANHTVWVIAHPLMLRSAVCFRAVDSALPR